MIRNLTIQNFKSVKNLDFTCKKINIFIGEPNAGKSNIIEALSLFSINQFSSGSAKDFVRFNNLTDLFFDQQIAESIIVTIDDQVLSLSFNKSTNTFNLVQKNLTSILESIDIDLTGSGLRVNHDHGVRFYEYKNVSNFNNWAPGFLSSPNGDNLATVLTTNTKLKDLISKLFRAKGFRLHLKPLEREILISKEIGEDIYSYPFSSVSETLRRIVFLMACIETNDNATVLFDEPESNTFPFYTKYFAERLALDETNQFFLTTHNPYLVESIVAKSKPEDLNIAVTFMDEQYETKTRVLEREEILDLMQTDIFFNLKRYTETA